MRYQDGMLEDLFVENPVSLVENSDKNFGIFVSSLDILINIYKTRLETLPATLELGW